LPQPVSPVHSGITMKPSHALAATLYGTVAHAVQSTLSAQQDDFDVLDYIDPFIGTANGGHVFAGATLPYGMAKSVADTIGENQAGFAYDDDTVYGFSHQHDDGTGGGASMGNFPIFAQSCLDLSHCKWQQSDRAVTWNQTAPKAYPGYFGIHLSNGVHAEMTVTNRSALYRFTLNGTSPLILMDLMDLPQSRTKGTAAIDKTGRMTGSGRFSPSFGEGHYNSFVCVDFKGAEVREVGTWMNNQPMNKTSLHLDGTVSAGSLSGGTFARFHGSSSILARVGVSFISTDQACHNAETEQPNFDFEATVAAAKTAWRKKLSTISIKADGVSKELQTIFWSGAYRTMISPQDYTGENPLWSSDEPYFDSYYCIWDSFRSIHPLLTLMDPQAQSLMLRSLVDIYRNEGYLPDCRMSLCKGEYLRLDFEFTKPCYTQGGSNADTVLADAYLKKIPGIDWATAYEAVVKDAEVEPANWDIEGRGGLAHWKQLGYIPTYDHDTLGTGTHTRSISRTVEYAYNDFCIAEMAKGLGHSADYEKYLNRSGNWINMYKSDQSSSIQGVNTNFTGFLQPRYMNGTWGYQDPIFCSPLLNFTSCYLNPDGHETYEGSAWLYTFYAPHDMGSLIKALGGKESFTRRLEYLHESGLLYVGDEQAFLTIFQFHYSGRPALSAKYSHFYIPSKFNTTVAGLAGNDDSGAMGSYIVLSMIGPYFKEASIKNAITGKIATIRNVNFDPSYKAIYIQSAKLNGKTWTKNWVTHDFFTNGGTLELTLGEEESDWGTANEDLPPSISDYSD
ncbi:hypothetical protein N7468_009579, partial [Penicillium chermesinum]